MSKDLLLKTHEMLERSLTPTHKSPPRRESAMMNRTFDNTTTTKDETKKKRASVMRMNET